MKKAVKKIIRYFLNDQQIHTLRMRIMKMISLKKNINTDFNLSCYGDKYSDTFFGYYDISPFSPNSNKAIYLSRKKNSNEAEIILSDLKTNIEEVICTTRAWNWQQGSRLRWAPNLNGNIMFNDFTGEKYITRILNTNTKEEHVIDWPLYDVDRNGKKGITLNFARLGVLRPGYGYTNTVYQAPQSLESEGINIINLDNGKSEKLITYAMINEVLGNNVTNYNQTYINHLSFSPSGNKFMFFWINIKDNGVHKADLLVYDIKTNDLIVLENDLSVSHYDWVDDNRIIVTAYDKKRECRYYIYNINGKRNALLHDVLTRDGHPTWLGNNEMITDTYVDKYGFQQLLYVDIENKKVDTLIDIYSSYKISGEKRCDLHPRINANNNDICFDANVKGCRKLYLLRGWSTNG